MILGVRWHDGGILVGLADHRFFDAKLAGDRLEQALGLLGPDTGMALLPRDQRGIAPDRLAIGAPDGLQVLFRPRVARDPYRIGERFWLCSAATPPGGGVHGLCGVHAARSLLRATG